MNRDRSTVTEAITRAERFKIVAESGCDERSVAAVYNGRPTRGATWGRVRDAAVKLRLPPPPPHVGQ